MGIFKTVSSEQQAAKDAEKAARAAERERQAFLATPGQAQTAFQRGDQLFQYAHDVENQSAVMAATACSRAAATRM
jgi:hypothetical protein